ncbi:hypothetical protein CDIK_2247 [Cucumispora dikerogammari]|nr:hypothetical protein CDIK_2247 [Cucumispora dikerogammari]
MIDQIKIATSLFISIFGITVYTLNRPMFYCGSLKALICFIFVGILSSSTIYLMGISYLKVLELKKNTDLYKDKTIYQTISMKLALSFSLIMISMNFLVAIVIFSEATKILKNCLIFYNFYSRFKLNFCILLIIVFIIGLQFINPKFKTKITFINTFIIFLFATFLLTLYFKKCHNNNLTIDISKINTDNKKFSFWQILSSICFGFSCQHVCISTFTKLKNKTSKNIIIITVLLLIMKTVGIYTIGLMGYFIVRNEKVYDGRPFDQNFLLEMSSEDSYFFQQFLIKKNIYFQNFTMLVILIMTYLLINTVSILSSVVIRAYDEILDVIFYLLRQSPVSEGNGSRMETFRELFHNCVFIILVVLGSFCLEPSFLLKYVSIVFGNIICFIIPGLMYCLILKKLSYYKKVSIADRIRYWFSHFLIIFGSVLIVIMLLVS